jgi:putative Mn2+ efflux pump MntP
MIDINIWIIVAVNLSVLFITLGTGANAAFKTPKNSSVIALKFALFMAVSYFCFYCIGAWITKYLIDLMINYKEMWILTAALLFFAVAVKTIWNVFSYKAEDNVYNLSKTLIQILLCIVAGFNSLLLSIALTLSKAPVLKTALIITLGAFAGSMSGARLSALSAKTVTKLRPALLGGGILLALAVYLFIKR